MSEYKGSMKAFARRHKGQKRYVFGTKLFVQLSGTWTAVDGSFSSAQEARLYARRNYRDDVSFRTEKIRFNCVPFVADKKAA